MWFDREIECHLEWASLDKDDWESCEADSFSKLTREFIFANTRSAALFDVKIAWVTRGVKHRFRLVPDDVFISAMMQAQQNERV